MNPSKNLPSLRRRLLCAQASLMVFAGSLAWAQVKTPDAATLAKYDKNHNGRLDADEVATMEADQRDAANTPTEKSDVVLLSPFEVVTDTKGYYSANSMSGTRFNSKLEDLASSITVVTKEQMQDFA